MGLRYVMLVDKAGTVYVSPAMHARLTFETEKPLTVVTGPVLDPVADGLELSHLRQATSPAKTH